MPVSVRISDDQSHLIYELSDPLQVNELMKAYDNEKEIRDSIAHTLHSIVDMSNFHRIPRNWLIAKAGPGLTHPRSGYMLIVGITQGLKKMVEIIFKITKYERIQFFESREEAEIRMAELVQQTKKNEVSSVSGTL